MPMKLTDKKERSASRNGSELEFLIRVEVSAKWPSSYSLPNDMQRGWIRESYFHRLPSYVQGPGGAPNANDEEIGVQYASYFKIVTQRVGGFSPDIDSIADITSDLEVQLEGRFEQLAFEKKVHLITQPIAIWDK